jgi:stage V sporulation protein D (sporulation-specific penicillin-binding protein)
VPRSQRDQALSGIFVLIVALSAVLALRLAYIQTIRRPFYLTLATKIQPVDRPRAGQPGKIRDRNGEVLADSVTVATVKVNPGMARRNEDIQKMAAFLAEKLGLSEAQVSTALTSTADLEYLAKGVPLETASAAMAGNFAGLGQDLSYRRNYPRGALACHVIGARGSDHTPIEGLESQFRFLLDGLAGTPITNVDAFGRSIVGQEDQPALPSQPGVDLYTTLDFTVQGIAEAALQRCWEEKQPKSATCIVLDCNTGEILALACRPNYDPNLLSHAEEAAARKSLQPEQMSNLCAGREYEPGSTFKPLCIAAALDAGVIQPTDRFRCEGTTSIGGRRLSCWGEWAGKGHGLVTPADILAKSCNLGAARIALKLGADRYVKFLRSVGIGESTRSGLPGEADGRLLRPETMRTRDLANSGFGQSVSVTDVQMAAAIAAVLNGGVYYRPHIIKAVTDKDGKVYREVLPQALRQVCSEETSSTLRQMLVGVVEHGTGRLARIEGATIGGKTGTAQIWDSKLKQFNGYMMSFTLVAPLDTKPQFVILVTVREPKFGVHAADVAAPVAREIALFMLKQRGLLHSANTAAAAAPAAQHG